MAIYRRPRAQQVDRRVRRQTAVRWDDDERHMLAALVARRWRHARAGPRQAAASRQPAGRFGSETAVQPSIKHGQPDRFLIRRGPLHPVPFMRGDVDIAARRQVDGFIALLEAQRGLALDQQHPFMLALVVPETGRGMLAFGDDALDFDLARLQQALADFSWQAGRDGMEQVAVLHASVCAAAGSSAQAAWLNCSAPRSRLRAACSNASAWLTFMRSTRVTDSA